VPYRKGRDAIVENYRRMFFADHTLAETIRGAVRGYVTRAGIPSDTLTAASALTWVTYANRKHAELADASDAGRAGAEHFPLVVIDDANRCLNLEILAERRANYLLTRL